MDHGSWISSWCNQINYSQSTVVTFDSFTFLAGNRRVHLQYSTERHQQQLTDNTPTTMSTPPPSKRKLFNTPTTSRRASSNTTPSWVNLTGYLIAVGEEQVAKTTRGKFIEIKLIIGKNCYEVVRIMSGGLDKERLSFYTSNIGSVVELIGVSSKEYCQFFFTITTKRRRKR